jgi:hypothetical protein
MVLPRLIRLRLAGQALPKTVFRRSLSIYAPRSTPILAASNTSRVPRPVAVIPRRWASSAALEVEEDEKPVEPEWPVRVLPTMSEQDTKRLKRQRNVGM